MKLSQIKPNPNNPRVIKDEKFAKLVKSIEEFPKMMELRPMVINSDGILLGGNMRLKALKELNYKEIPDSWVRRADQLTEDEQRRFIIADNVGFGEWDWEMINADWDIEELEDWGLDVPDFGEAIDEGTDPFDDAGITAANKYAVTVICENEAEQEVIYMRLTSEGLTCKIVVV